jgi:hypothetical protein
MIGTRAADGHIPAMALSQNTVDILKAETVVLPAHNQSVIPRSESSAQQADAFIFTYKLAQSK